MLTWLTTLTEPRARACIPLHAMALCAFMLVAGRLGSLNALERCRYGKIWKRYGRMGKLPSADQLGRVTAAIPARDVRRQLKVVYGRLKRRKALHPASHDNLFALVLDGHECMTSYVRCCGDCLVRRMNKGTPRERPQYYHRLVMGVLVCKRFTVLLDAEMQCKGEDEVRTAQRLLERLLIDYPRAFDLVVADGLYARAPFFKKVRASGKHVIAVLKHENRDLTVDAKALCTRHPSRWFNTGTTKRQVWDIEHLASWPQTGMAVRVVRSLETTSVKRHTGTVETKTVQWMWVTTIPEKQLCTRQFIDVAHDRWRIENNAFNELVTYWHADHVYKHHANAILFFWLMTMLAYNLFHSFFHFNIKPAMQKRFGKYRIASFLSAELLMHDIPPRMASP